MKLFYYKAQQGNFGDDLNGWLWEELAPGRWSDEADTLFCGIGTIIGNAMPDASRVRIFSSGIGYRPAPADIGSRKWDVVALRGPLTAQVVGRPDKAMADGALLLATLERLRPLPASQRKDVIFIPHFEALADGDWATLCQSVGIDMVDPRDCAHAVIDRIRSARLVIADSMHAAIIADTMRVPWVPVSTSGRINSFKWLDWTLSLDLPYEPVRLGAISAASAYQGQVRRIIGEDYRLPRPEREKALAHHAKLTRREQSPWWQSNKPRIKHHLMALPRRVPTIGRVQGVLSRWDERQRDRIAGTLARLSREAGFLSGDAIFARRVDQLHHSFHSMLRTA